ncbi:MAG: UDP-2,3-diacylglucosamine diphosphatase [Burkholderiales bacterium]|nr:UDP-2,3-diacylglucosamine diphosphatase [Burkholderiales bacterium]
MIHTLTAPAHWQQVDLLSDLHLGPETPGTLARLQRHLAETPAQAVLLLGDIFEVWVGDDARTLPFEAGCVAMLREASQRLDLFFMHGNRDFLVGADMLAACGMTALPDPTLLAAFGQRWLLVHGDAQCLDDTAYQAFRSQVRSHDLGGGLQRVVLSDWDLDATPPRGDVIRLSATGLQRIPLCS